MKLTSGSSYILSRFKMRRESKLLHQITKRCIGGTLALRRAEVAMKSLFGEEFKVFFGRRGNGR